MTRKGKVKRKIFTPVQKFKWTGTILTCTYTIINEVIVYDLVINSLQFNCIHFLVLLSLKYNV